MKSNSIEFPLWGLGGLTIMEYSVKKKLSKYFENSILILYLASNLRVP
jgi:hypothetical protein